MTDKQRIAYEWAKSHEYPSVAAQYARELAGLVDDLTGVLLVQQEHRCPCDLCGFGPPSSMNGKPCTICPAAPKAEHFREDTKRNKPLTLNELRKMDGEPVWIKLFDPDEEFWVLRNEWVDTRNPEPMILFHMRWYSHADYGKTWLAYRQKPEETSHG